MYVFHFMISASTARHQRHCSMRCSAGGLSNLQCLLGTDSCKGHSDIAFDVGSRLGMGQCISWRQTGCAKGESCDIMWQVIAVMWMCFRGIWKCICLTVAK